MTTFQRARSEEQRELRRRAIFETAADMLAEMPVAQVSLNELSRRVGLAKSNVLRYFESREAILLELLDSAWQEWLAQLAPDLDEAIDARTPAVERGDQVAAVLASSLAARPVFCDLLSAQAAVLEHNLSPQVAAQYKHAALSDVTVLGQLIGVHLPELDDHRYLRLGVVTIMVVGSIWPHSQPSAAVLAAYEADPLLATLRIDFADAVREVLEVLIAGLLARAERRRTDLTV